MPTNREIQAFAHGVENLVSDEIISQDAASDAQNWFSQDDKLQLIPGKALLGAQGVAGNVTGEIFGYKVDGTKIHWRKIGSTIQYLNGTTWTTTISNLTAAADYSFANYSSLAGDFTFAIGVDGIFKINNANPGSYIPMYDASRNFKGLGIIDKGRMLLWNMPTDKTGLYGSHIDPQNSSVYTTVTNEVSALGDGSTKTFSGSLSFKAIQPLANAFGVSISAPTGSPVTITGITNALTPVITTSTPHGLVAGDTAITAGLLGSNTGTGTVSAGPGNYEITGVGTSFSSQLQAGNRITIAGFAGISLIIQTVNSNTVLTLKYPLPNSMITFTSLAFTYSNMSQMNNIPVKVLSATTNTVTVNADTTFFDIYSSGGTLTKSETLTDNNLGTLTSLGGATGTINYMTGAYSFTLQNAVVNTQQILTSYLWENSNSGGVTDFTHSGTRLAGEGFVFRQDEGGDPILNVLIGTNGYYSMKSQSSYLLTLDPTDLNASNTVYRKLMGLPAWRAAVSADAGIVFLNTANPEKPEMTILIKNVVDGTLEPKVLFPQFKFANYIFSDCTLSTYDRYILVACKSLLGTNNDTVLLCNVTAGTVDITGYAARTFVSNQGLLYMGSSVTQSVYNLFSGFDDDGSSITNYWISKNETYAIKSRSLKYMLFGTSLKKYRAMKLRGHITPGQSYQVYISYDDAGFQLVGTVLGTADYVNYASPNTVGSNEVGLVQLGGNILDNTGEYFLQIRLKKMPKFRKRQVKFVAMGIGYVDIEYQMDWDIVLYENKLPSISRQKQNVSLDGKTTDEVSPEF